MACTDITLTGLGALNPCAKNIGGVKTIYIAPRADVTSINFQLAESPSSLDGTVTVGSSSSTGMAVTCANNKGFVKVYCADDMGELKYTSQGKHIGGRSFKASLEIFNPGFHRTGLGFLNYFNNADAIIIVKLNNGECHLLGDTDRGAMLAEGNEVTSGKATSDDNGINPVFEWNTSGPLVFFDGWDPEDSSTGLPLVSSSSANEGE